MHRPRPAVRRGLRAARVVPLLVAGAVLLAACTAGPADDRAEAPTPAPTPAPGPAPDPAPAPENDAASTMVVAVHLVRTAPTTFFVEPVPVRVPAVGEATAARATAAVEALLLLEGTTDEGLTTSVPPGTTLVRVSVEDGVATVDLAGGIVGSSGSSAQETTFAQQLAHTVRVDTSIGAVRLLVGGQPITELWGHLDWSQPVPVDPFALSPVTVTTPLAGEDVPVGPVTFRGQATVFEGTVLVTLVDADGTVVDDGFVTATQGGPGRGTWEWTVTLPAPGTYTLTASETDPSDGEGRPPYATSRTIRATG